MEKFKLLGRCEKTGSWRLKKKVIVLRKNSKLFKAKCFWENVLLTQVSSGQIACRRLPGAFWNFS